MDFFWIICGIILLCLLLRYVPLYSRDVIEGELVTSIGREIGLTPSVTYYFKNFCKSCLERKVRMGGTVWNCYLTTPKRIITIGSLPKMGESVKMTIYFSAFGEMVICKWTKTSFKTNPEKVKRVQEYIAQHYFNPNNTFHG